MLTVFYTSSFYGKERYRAEYEAVLTALKSFSGINLIGTEVGNYQDFLSQRLRKRFEGDPKLLHYTAIRHGIALSDAVVIEASQEDFQLGHEATLALDTKKPTLLL